MTLVISVLKNIFSCILKCKCMTLAISNLKIIFPLHIKIQDYHLMYSNVLANATGKQASHVAMMTSKRIGSWACLKEY